MVHWRETESQMPAPQSAFVTQSRQVPVAVSHRVGPRQSRSFAQPTQTPAAVSQCDVAPVQSSSVVHGVPDPASMPESVDPASMSPASLPASRPLSGPPQA
jgi:hypothetical protein